MSDEMIRAFLDNIRAEPDEEVHRLALADWLEENGQPERAEFIRVQVQLAPLSTDDSRRLPLEKRERALLRRYRESWLGALQGLLSRRSYWHFGFEDGLLYAGVWQPDLGRGESVAGAKEWAWVEKLRLCGGPEGLNLHEALKLPFLSGITCLSLDLGCAGDGPRQQCLSALAACPELERITYLDLRENFLEPEGAQTLASSPYLGRLAHLDLAYRNGIGPAGAQALACSPQLAHLTYLDLDGNRIGPKGARALASSPYLTRLKYLNLCDNHIGSEGVRALTASLLLANLTRLNLSFNDFGDRGISDLVRAHHLQSLKHLDLGGNHFGRRGVRALAKWPLLSQLTSLDLGFGDIDSAGACALAESPHVAGLAYLCLDGNAIDEDGGVALARSPYLDNLALLSLRPGCSRKRNPLSTSAKTLLRKRFRKRVLF